MSTDPAAAPARLPSCRTCGFADCPGAAGADCPRWPERGQRPDDPMSDFYVLLRSWRAYLEMDHGVPRSDVFTRAVSMCASALEDTIKRAVALQEAERGD